MHRRRFVTASLAASLSLRQRGASQPFMPSSPQPDAQEQPEQREHPAHGAPSGREFYHLRRYQLQAGPQTALAESYFNEALIPALTRLGLGPVGAFKLDIGPETPTYYLLVPGGSVDAVSTMDNSLANDEAFLKSAQPFWGAPASSPAYQRLESSLLLAFEGWPRLRVPSATAGGSQRIFQLRNYESPSHAAHVRKVEMFNNGEFDIFQRTGLHPVFFGETLIGPRMPSLTYMLTFSGMTELETNWAAFSADPAWKKLSTSSRYAYESIVSNISNLILSPLAASQI